MTGQWLDGKPGFGSIRVTARIGETAWATSVFPDKASGGWVLPVKKAVRVGGGHIGRRSGQGPASNFDVSARWR